MPTFCPRERDVTLLLQRAPPRGQENKSSSVLQTGTIFIKSVSSLQYGPLLLYSLWCTSVSGAAECQINSVIGRNKDLFFSNIVSNSFSLQLRLKLALAENIYDQ